MKTTPAAALLAALALAPLSTLAAGNASVADAQRAMEFARQQATPGAPWMVPAPEGRSPELWAFMDRLTDWTVRTNPEWAGSSLDDERFNDRLSDNSAEAIMRQLSDTRAFRDALAKLDRSGFSEADTLDAGLIAYMLDRRLTSAELNRWQMPINSMSGPQVWLPQLGDRVPLTSDKHYTDYLTRLKQVPIAVGDAIDNMRRGIADERVPPRVVVEPAVEQAMAQASSSIIADPRTSPFFAPFRDLPEADPRVREAEKVIAERIVPVFQELAVFLQNEYIPATRASIGISEGVDGIKAYEIALAEHTTLDLTADEVHELGLSEVARIRAEMMDVIARTDWEGNSKDWPSDDARFDAFVDYLRTDPRFYVDSPEELLRAYRDIAKVMDAEMPKLFRTLPRLPYGVRPIPEFAAKSSPTAYYYRGSVESGVPGYFMANTYALDQRPLYDVVALTLHEAVPGHHHQISIAQELEGVHPIRRLMGFTAYVEGWGLYAERLGLEVGDDLVDDGVERGLYADPYDDFGRLNYEMWRACRLVVDTGMHAKEWSRERAVEFMLTNTANTRLDTENEINRYIGWPGQATAYKIGELKIRELRARAEEELGEAFDVRDFHDAVLDAGSLPLPVLEDKITRWIGAQQ